LRAFSSLLALMERRRVAVLASYSPELTTSKLSSQIVRWREAGAAHCRLPALGDAETELLIRSAAPHGRTPSSDALRAMLRSAQGNPRIAVELAEALAGDSGDLLIAPSAAAAVAELREQLAPEAFEVLRLCSVIGDEFCDTWIVDLSDVAPASVAATLQLATDRHVLVETGESPGRLRFRRTAVREALYASTVALNRRLLHKRAVEYLSRQKKHDARGHALLARHWHVLGNDREAANSFAGAAKQCAARGDYVAAADAYTQALRHMRIGSKRWFDAAHELRRCLRNLAGWARMIPVVESMLAALDESRDRETARSLLWDLFYARLNNGELESARAVAERIGEASAALIVAYALNYAARLEEARELLGTIEFDDLTDPEARLRHLIASAAIGALYNPLEYALDRIDRAAEIATGVGLRGTVLCYDEGIEIAMRCGNLEAARSYENRGAAVAAKTKGDVNDVKRRLDKDRIRIAMLAGDLAAARSLLYGLLDWRDFGRHNQSFFAGVGVQIGMRTGDFALVDAFFDPALLSAAIGAGDAESAGLLLPGCADVMLARGMAKELQSLFERCAVARLIDPYLWIPQCVARHGTLECAEAAAQTARDYLRGAVAPAALAHAAMLRALVARRQNKHIAAGEAAREAALRFQRIGYRLSEAAALELSGERGAASLL
jgi:hypothetical protein